jgi:hypothetical protein
MRTVATLTACAAALSPLASARAASTTLWDKQIAEERERHSTAKFVETGASGLAAFAIGVYGLHFDNQGFITSSVYALLQSGGIILMAEGLKNFLETSAVANMDAAFRNAPNNSLTHEKFRSVWQKSAQANERATNISELFMWSGLTAVYLNSAFREPKSASTARSLYFFLAANGAILAGAAGYKLLEWEQHSLPTRPQSSSISLQPIADGIALNWQKRL